MLLSDIIRYNTQILIRNRWRSVALTTCIAIGVASVILLTGLGEGARQYVQNEFNALGTNLIVIFPGKRETAGAGPPIYGTSPRDLTIEDSSHIAHLPGVKYVAPVIAGNAVISYGARSREVITIGSTDTFIQTRNLSLAMGQNLPANSAERGEAVCVLGIKLYRELFGNENPLGQMISVEDYRYRVIGVLSERGESLGLDMRDMLLIPVRSAEMMFNTPGLFRILVQLTALGAQSDEAQDKAIDQIYELIKSRHHGEEDITIVTQQSMMDAFNSILVTLTAVIGFLAGISLLVAGILIMNLSLISVQRRRPEIGLLKAMGASIKTIQWMILLESGLLILFASIVGLALAHGLLWLVTQFFPYLPLQAPIWINVLALAIALVTGMLFSLLPARRAGSVPPAEVLRG
ncbi:ABC transporter permease [Paraneptunicella aestuarii]|uniref:ABC transporter permease n=1 Tax=Paraneptunicella aestuarii TaxID=2831148 RepID=UPI001E3612E1|nr:ABC transporter permease [Paraneptunicella aestuarii]UAA39044.1 ABC transporter permease [Paraneptunicella aestuarii]